MANGVSPDAVGGVNGGGLLAQLRQNVVDSGRSPGKTWLGFLVAWAAFFLILNMAPLPGLKPEGQAVLAVMVWACLMWIFECVPPGVSCILIPMLLVMSGGSTPFPKAASGFTTPVLSLCLAAFLFAAIMQAAGLDRRIALVLLQRFKAKTVNGVIWSMFAVNIVLSFIIPAANARAATLLPVINGICNFFGDTEEERNGKKAIVIQTLVYGSMIAGMCILTAHLPNLVIVSLFEKQLKLQLSYVDWFVMQWPYLGMFVITQWWVQWYFRTRGVSIKGGLAVIEKQRAELPRMKASEWTIIGIFVLIALMWMFESQLVERLAPTLRSHNAALIGVALLFIPGLFGFKWQEIQSRTIWGTLLLLAGALSLSGAMADSGLAKYLADKLHPVSAGQSWWWIVLVFMVGTHIMRLGMLSNIAAITMIAPILVALAPKLNLHPVAFTMLVADTDTFAYILPTQITAAVIAYSTGTFTASDYAKVGIVSVLVAIAYGLLVMAPWYAFLGVPVWDPAAPWPFKKL
jgi:anion transporter